MKQPFKCFLSAHEFEVFKEEDVKLAGTDLVVAKAIVSKCKHCGKITVDNISTITFNY